MIHVDVYIPAVNKSYEFSLNENIKLSYLIEEIVQIVEKQEQRIWSKEVDKLLLCDCDGKHILPYGKTLYECGMDNGNRLILL